MYFFRKKKERFLDMRGTFVLSHNDVLAKARYAGDVPKFRNVTSIHGIPTLSNVDKIKTSIMALKFIWGRSTAMNSNEEFKIAIFQDSEK